MRVRVEAKRVTARTGGNRVIWEGELSAVPRPGDWVSVPSLSDLPVESVTWMLSVTAPYALVQVKG